MSCDTTNFMNPSTPCNKPLGLLKMLVFAKDHVSFADNTAALTYAGWQALIQSKDIVPVPAAMMTESNQEEAIYEETALKSVLVREGKDQFKYVIDANLDLHSKLRTFNASDYTKLFEIYTSGAIVGTKPDGADIIYPLAISTLFVEKQVAATDTTVAKTQIKVTFEDIREKNDAPAIVVPEWNPFTKLAPLANVVLKVISASATTVVITATEQHANAAVQEPVRGLVAGDFLLTTAAGVTETIGGSVEDAQVAGKYTLTGTGLVTGFANLKTPATMTTKGYESTSAVAKTVA